MSVDWKSRRIALPRSRRLTCDVLHFHRKVPTCAHERIVNLSEVHELRSQLPTRISWPVLFIKAYALVAQKRPVLRQMWCRWPWRHLIQHPVSVGMLAIQREYQGEPWLFWGRMSEPESASLTELQGRLDRYLQQPVERIFKKQLQLSAFPTPIRRALWWYNLNLTTAARAKRVGTFFLTTLAAKGVEIPHPPSFQTGNLSYGPLDDNGNCRVTLAYDHRLTDGLQIAECLAELEAALCGPIASELRALVNGSSRLAA